MTERKIDLAVFDYDGTIKKRGSVGEPVVNAFDHLHQRTIRTTLMTGKGYPLLRKRLGMQWSNIISEGVPVGLENGGRIVNSEQKNITYHPLTEEEVESVIDAVKIHRDSVELLAYHPSQALAPMVIWSGNTEIRQQLLKDEADLTAISFSLDNLYKQILRDHPCMLIIKTKNDEAPVFPEGLNVVTNEGVVNISSENVDKGLGVQEMSDILNVDLNRILVAGNDENDRPMLSLPTGKKVFVSNGRSFDWLQPNTETVGSPDELASFLKKI